jgi:ABC-type multidrug transport system fused ATPase/permease subunit
LVGRSGAGKSTLIKLLLRHYNLTGGSIRIDGQDIALQKQTSVRKEISVVPQEPLLLHRTIRENIAYGKPDATEAEIKTAAKLARADGFIKRMSNDTATR